MKIDLFELKKEIMIAIEIGKKAASDYPDDDGSFNLDSAFVNMKKVRKLEIDRLGLPGYLAPANSRQDRRLYLPTPFSGQANRRTQAVEAMANYLKERGYDCCVHYRVD